MKTAFRKELEQLINRENMESGSNTPDFLLAEFLCDVLEAFDRVQRDRETWYREAPKEIHDPITHEPPLTFQGTQNEKSDQAQSQS